jgi:DNA-binding response OmpR family regulator
MKLLLIEDEPQMLKAIKQYLLGFDYVCESAGTLPLALEKIALYDYDCIVVDITLPGGSGLTVIRAVKEMKSTAGIIIVTARDSVEDKIAGLELGADDYLTKPFHLSELGARIKALLRRSQFDGQTHYQWETISYQTEAREIRVNNNLLALTGKEYDLLVYLLRNAGKVVTKEAIAEHLWGDLAESADSFDFLYTHIKNIRHKIKIAGGEDYIQTVYRIGYKLTAIT